MNFNISNVYKAWLSTLIGVVITVLSGIISQANTGHVNWHLVIATGSGALLLALTDILKEVQKEITGTDGTTPAAK